MTTDGNDNERIEEAAEAVLNRPVISFTFHAPDSAECDVRIDGVNEIQLFGASKMLEQAGVEHMARRAMQDAMQAAQAAQTGIVPATPSLVRQLEREQ